MRRPRWSARSSRSRLQARRAGSSRDGRRRRRRCRGPRWRRSPPRTTSWWRSRRGRRAARGRSARSRRTSPVRDLGERRHAPHDPELVPAHVRHLALGVAREADDAPGEDARGPRTPGDSSLSSNSSCMPTQMPRNGRPDARPRAARARPARGRAGSACTCRRRPAPAARRAGADAMRSGSLVTSAACPRRSNAFCALRRLPTP